MFGGEFIFSVTREFVRGCVVPMLLMPGDDVVHPSEVSADLAVARISRRSRHGRASRDAKSAMRRVREFLIENEPAPAGGPR